ncbi:hypothetical protein [Macrococcoides caseolyticum]|uniref:hypothetical protein n=1 Tax=Macrococcoides caseolyticum TaxID=69966 RepID=UPI001F1A3E0B|nr:hypothetical protein [Macrococcus caseolyticus]MCE4957423.1 hypothetical protein [Macrococcus caseolyticus]
MKKYIIIILTIALLFGVGAWLYSYCTTPDNDLSNEQIGNLLIKDTFENKDKAFAIDPMVQLDGKLFYRLEKDKGLIVRVDKKKKQITAIMLFHNKKIQTSRDIAIGHSKEAVIDAYGETYKKSLLPKKQTQFYYKDKENHIGMKFIFKKDNLVKIELFEE